MTPVLQRPLELGADIVIHATTKYFGGHSDVTGGAVVVREGLELASRLRFVQTETGPVPSPFDAWLLRRGMKTLPLRVRAQSETAGRLAEFLNGHPRVAETFYPGLPGDPGHEVQTRQADGYGAMLSFRVDGGEDHARRMVSRVQLIVRATSLGGVESLIEHRALVEGPDSETPPRPHPRLRRPRAPRRPDRRPQPGAGIATGDADGLDRRSPTGTRRAPRRERRDAANARWGVRLGTPGSSPAPAALRAAHGATPSTLKPTHRPGTPTFGRHSGPQGRRRLIAALPHGTQTLERYPHGTQVNPTVLRFRPTRA